MKNIFLGILIVLAVFAFMGSVAAADNDLSSINNIEIHDLSSSDNSVGTFDELNKDISNLSPGDVYNMDKDYIFESNANASNCSNEYIKCSCNNITINGNGHIIDGNYKSAVFKIMGNDVKICNITIKHAISDMSPIFWSGNSGVIDNCIFVENGGINGGSITWKGNDGLINNSRFFNNTAKGVGGAIFLSEVNNINIANCLIRNSTSLMGEAIFLDRKHGNYTLINVQFQSRDNTLFDGKDIVDAKYLESNYFADFMGKTINIVPCLFKSIVSKNINFINNNTGYYCQCDVNSKNETFFTFNLFRLFDMNITYIREYQIYNPKDANDIFDALLEGNFNTSAAIFKSIMINDKKEYESLFKQTYQNLVNKTEPMTIINKFEGNNSIPIRCLCVSFNSSLVINSREQFKIDPAFNLVNIYGNGAKISIKSNEDDEYKWLSNDGQYYSINDLTISGFNHALINNGSCILNNVTLCNNHILYMINPEDWGSALLNLGTCLCINSTFKNNKARCGGAIFNQGDLTLNNCDFNNNQVPSKNSFDIGHSGIGKDICNAGNGNIHILNNNVLLKKPVIENAGGLKATGHAVVGIVAPIVSAVVGTTVACLTRSIRAGIIAGAIAGLVSGAIGSACVCYNTFDARFPFLKYSIGLTFGSVVSGIVGGATPGAMAKIKLLTTKPVSAIKNTPKGTIDKGFKSLVLEDGLSENRINKLNEILTNDDELCRQFHKLKESIKMHDINNLDAEINSFNNMVKLKNINEPNFCQDLMTMLTEEFTLKWVQAGRMTTEQLETLRFLKTYVAFYIN